MAGCVFNQGQFYDRFGAVVLLTAPEAVLLARVAARTTNPYGKSEAERASIRRDIAEVEPLLRRGASAVIDTTRPLAEVADRLESLAQTVGPAPLHPLSRADDRSLI